MILGQYFQYQFEVVEFSVAYDAANAPFNLTLIVQVHHAHKNGQSRYTLRRQPVFFVVTKDIEMTLNI